MKKVLFCENCDKKLDVAWLEGSSIVDRFFDGVMFEVYVDEKDEFHCIGVRKMDEEWFDNFNKEKWIERVTARSKKEDFFICPTCGGDIDNLWYEQ